MIKHNCLSCLWIQIVKPSSYWRVHNFLTPFGNSGSEPLERNLPFWSWEIQRKPITLWKRTDNHATFITKQSWKIMQRAFCVGKLSVNGFVHCHVWGYITKVVQRNSFGGAISTLHDFLVSNPSFRHNEASILRCSMEFKSCLFSVQQMDAHGMVPPIDSSSWICSSLVLSR